MANAVAAGAQEAGALVELLPASEFGTDRMDSFDAVAFGCPSMGVEQLEEDVFAPMFAGCEPKLGGKRIALFGILWLGRWRVDAFLGGRLPTPGGSACLRQCNL